MIYDFFIEFLYQLKYSYHKVKMGDKAPELAQILDFERPPRSKHHQEFIKSGVAILLRVY